MVAGTYTEINTYVVPNTEVFDFLLGAGQHTAEEARELVKAGEYYGVYSAYGTEIFHVADAKGTRWVITFIA